MLLSNKKNILIHMLRKNIYDRKYIKERLTNRAFIGGVIHQQGSLIRVSMREFLESVNQYSQFKLQEYGAFYSGEDNKHFWAVDKFKISQVLKTSQAVGTWKFPFNSSIP